MTTLEQFDSSVSQCRAKILANEVTPEEIQGSMDVMKKCGEVKRAEAAAKAEAESAKLEAAKDPVEEPVI